MRASGRADDLNTSVVGVCGMDFDLSARIVDVYPEYDGPRA
jgi:hypothetical protein